MKENTSQCHIPMEGAFNFRDMGGIPTADGRHTRWGKLFRSDDLHKLTSVDLDYLASIPIASVVDFRSESEMKSAPDKLPEGAVNYPFSIDPGNLSAAADLSALAETDMDSLMIQIYIMLVTEEENINRYRDFFALLQNKENLPLVFHCSAGKDRTGIGAALTLFALGVDEDEIMKDYLLSNQFIVKKYAAYVAQYPELKPLFEVKPEYLNSAIQRIKKDHGHVENYLVNVLGVDIDRIRDLLLIPFM